ncbi:MAG: type II secretion system F family protein [Alphaproteobacteria bacterium]|nr:type II secretion system F family protein [Alphaproteobacteria bacterium]MDE2042689.1 type II secretion system F family protein [Alphaproteobacteria bacterium]
MSILPILIMLGGVVVVIAMLFMAFAGPSADKARNRRLNLIKDRHGDGDSNIIEKQMRRIQMARDNRMDGLASRILPKPDLMRKRIAMTGMDWTLGKYMMASGGLAVAVALVCLFEGTTIALALIVGILVGLAFPHLAVGFLITRRLGKFNATFPDAIDLMVRGLRSGLPITETLGIVGGEIIGPVGEEFRLVADKIKIGRTMDAALQDTANRIGTPEFQFFTITLVIQRETGGNLAETLANLSDVLRKRSQMKLKVKALSSEAKASAYIVGSLPFIVFSLIWMENRPYLEAFFHKPILELTGLIALGWMGIGVGWMAKMINFEI